MYDFRINHNVEWSVEMWEQEDRITKHQNKTLKDKVPKTYLDLSKVFLENRYIFKMLDKCFSLY